MIDEFRGKHIRRMTGSAERIKIHVGTHKIGDQEPYFSVTCDIEEKAGNSRWVDVGGGAAHDTILRVMPKLKPVVDLHLSTDKGVPMHAVENGWYWLGRTQWVEYDREALARHLRITPEEADEIERSVSTKEEFAEVVDSMRERWAEEAKAALALIESLSDSEGEAG